MEQKNTQFISLLKGWKAEIERDQDDKLSIMFTNTETGEKPFGDIKMYGDHVLVSKGEPWKEGTVKPNTICADSFTDKMFTIYPEAVPFEDKDSRPLYGDVKMSEWFKEDKPKEKYFDLMADHEGIYISPKGHHYTSMTLSIMPLTREMAKFISNMIMRNVSTVEQLKDLGFTPTSVCSREEIEKI